MNDTEVDNIVRVVIEVRSVIVAWDTRVLPTIKFVFVSKIWSIVDATMIVDEAAVEVDVASETVWRKR